MNSKNRKYVPTFEQYLYEQEQSLNESTNEGFVGKALAVGAAGAIIASPVIAGVAIGKAIARIGKKRKYINTMLANETDPQKKAALKKQLQMLSRKELEVRAKMTAKKTAKDTSESENNVYAMRDSAAAKAKEGIGHKLAQQYKKGWNNMGFVKKAAIVGGAAYGASKLVALVKRKRNIQALLTQETNPAKKAQLKAQLQGLNNQELALKRKDMSAKAM